MLKVLLCAVFSVTSALRNVQLVTDEGEEAIKGGQKMANCHACLAVMEDVQISMKKPFEKVGCGPFTHELIIYACHACSFMPPCTHR